MEQVANAVIIGCQVAIALSCLWIAARLLIAVYRRKKKESNRIFIVLGVFIGLRGLVPLAAFVMVYFGYNTLFVVSLVAVAVSSVIGVVETERLAPEIEKMPDIAEIQEARDHYLTLRDQYAAKVQNVMIVGKDADRDREKLDEAADKAYALLESALAQIVVNSDSIHKTSA